MTTTQKALLSCSAICYILVLFGFLQPALWLAVPCFILHSISLLSFAWLSSRPLASQPREGPDEEAREDGRDGDFSLLPPLPGQEGRQEPVDIIRIVRDTIQEFLPFSQRAGIQIEVSSSADSLLVRADGERIRILFRNIIDNSIKYMNRAGSLVITLSTVGSDIFIVLKDNGKGLPEQETPHIFEINYQGSNRISGNGLGLTQAKAIVESYGGTIYAKSTIGKGMGIYIQIPID